ncbi:MAG: DUF2971 domain-containing protein [Ruminococcus sp.]|nr:DUF2971 domain-containing protein [Ruminococcus sp.]
MIDNEVYTDDWKNELHTQLITSLVNRQNTNDSIFEKIGYYYTCCAPAFLYKYCGDSNRTIENLKANKIWFSAPCNFNDVFDCDILIDDNQVFQNTLELIPNKREFRKGSSKWRMLNQKISKGLRKLRANFEKMKTTIGVFCLSELDDSLLMWSHYANNHCGICVEYELLSINKQLGFSPVPVIYSSERSSIRSINPNTIDTDTKSVFIKSLISKSPEWSYEKEWRIIQDKGACGINWNTENKGALRDMVRPRSVILGCMAKTEFEKEIYDYCEENKINLYKMVKNKSLYKLDKTQILQFDE